MRTCGRPSRAGAVLAVAAACALAACGGAIGSEAHDASAAAASTVRPIVVDARSFAASVREVVLAAPSSGRTNLLAGAVRRQLAHARERFQSGGEEPGVAAVTGAFYLLRAGELRPEMLEGGSDALLLTATEMGRVGDEGRAQALYSMLESALPPGPTLRDVQQHVQALKDWAAHAKSEGPLRRLGARQRALAVRSLLEATPEVLEAATQATIDWIEEAQRANLGELNIRSQGDREEALEGYRAMRAGGPLLVALHLRHGSAGGALRALERADLYRFVPPNLRDRLERAEQRDPEAWLDLFRLFNEQDDERFLPEGLARAAAFGAALELYRISPEEFSAALPLAVLLIEHGMAEVAPEILAPTLRDSSEAEDLTHVTSLILHAMTLEDRAGDLGGARRTFANAAPILKRAALPAFRGTIRPSAADLRFAMGSLEARAGDLVRARPLIEAASGGAPDAEVWTALAAIDRQRGHYDEAAELLTKVIQRARKSQDSLLEAETLTTLFEVRRDQGKADEAARTLRAALGRVLDARKLVRSAPKQARAERVLARVLEHYKLAEAARRATRRAYTASRSDARQLAATVLDAARRALTQGDLPSAREAVQQAIDAGLPDEDMVYVALWLNLLETKLGVQSDGTVEEALALIEGGSGWPSRLRSWALGSLNDSGLLGAAHNTIQKTEAQFYAAMAKYVRGAGVGSELLAVAKSEAIELVEVTIARDLVANERRRIELQPLADLVLP